jgi:hypothetical protein
MQKSLRLVFASGLIESRFNPGQVPRLNLGREDLPGYSGDSDDFIKPEVLKEASKSSEQK